ncbi:MAG: zinc-ribbon domain-containing protein, partial [Lachnospiraceae bacterium]|nr:zinc-ribbon domain-containing protein [Lachnospiraceae bacterium]
MAFCPTCGSQLPEGAETCPSCGNPLPSYHMP